MSDDADCGCGWVATEHGRAFVQCTAHRESIAVIVGAAGESSIYRFEDTVWRTIDAEIEDRLRRGFKGVDHKPSPLGRIR